MPIIAWTVRYARANGQACEAHCDNLIFEGYAA